MIENIVGGIISTFVGFFLAMWLQRATDKQNQEKRDLLIIKSVSDELQDIGVAINQYLDKAKVISSNIYTPNFDALMSSGMLIELIDDDCYPYIVDVFSMIKRLNDERNSINADEQFALMTEIVKCVDNVTFLTKKYKSKEK